jgi:hypothetical protein
LYKGFGFEELKKDFVDTHQQYFSSTYQRSLSIHQGYHSAGLPRNNKNFHVAGGEGVGLDKELCKGRLDESALRNILPMIFFQPAFQYPADNHAASARTAPGSSLPIHPLCSLLPYRNFNNAPAGPKQGGSTW